MRTNARSQATLGKKDTFEARPGSGWTLDRPIPRWMTDPAVLFVDDEPGVLRALERSFRHQYRVVCCSGGGEALRAMADDEVAVIVTDHAMPEMTGLGLLRAVTERFPSSRAVRIVLSAQTDLELLGSFVNECRIAHFVSKPFEVDELRRVVRSSFESYALAAEKSRRAAELASQNEKLARENRRLRRRLETTRGFDRLIGNSSKLKNAIDRARMVCSTDVTVHVRGETGTGKELLARAIHEGGARADRPFVAQNCAGLGGALLQSTLFGHRKGSFTGADRDRPGVFQQADGGTLFLDEVAELTADAQAALLRVLQEGEVVPVGATTPERVDVRLISATHVDLRERVTRGTFREDLFYRLVVMSLELPSLRERPDDVPALAAHFLHLHTQKHGKDIPAFHRETMQKLERYDWPGNVRQLANEIERLVVLAEPNHEIGPELLSMDVVHPRDETDPDGLYVPFGISYDEAHERVSRWLIERALDESGGVIRKAADALSMERSRLAKLRRRLGIHVDPRGAEEANAESVAPPAG